MVRHQSMTGNSTGKIPIEQRTIHHIPAESKNMIRIMLIRRDILSARSARVNIASKFRSARPPSRG